MRLPLPDPGPGYRSASQRVRVATESWGRGNLYCPSCSAPRLSPHPNNRAVADFACPRCGLELQLKAKNGRFGRAFTNSAYAPKVDAIRRRALPDYALLSYDRAAWRVRDLRLLPGHFIPEAAVVPRRPLSQTARRAGWVGSIVRIHEIPSDAFVSVIRDGVARPPADVRRDYRRFEFLREEASAEVGWLADVLAHVRRLAPEPGMEFNLRQLYAVGERDLASRHRQNRHVQAKIRQQLQRLRDQGVLAFVAKGRYRMRT